MLDIASEAQEQRGEGKALELEDVELLAEAAYNHTQTEVDTFTYIMSQHSFTPEAESFLKKTKSAILKELGIADKSIDNVLSATEVLGSTELEEGSSPSSLKSTKRQSVEDADLVMAKSNDKLDSLPAGSAGKRGDQGQAVVGSQKGLTFAQDDESEEDDDAAMGEGSPQRRSPQRPKKRQKTGKGPVEDSEEVSSKEEMEEDDMRDSDFKHSSRAPSRRTGKIKHGNGVLVDPLAGEVALWSTVYKDFYFMLNQTDLSYGVKGHNK